MITLLLLTTHPTERLAWHSFELAQSLLKKQQKISVFFYQNAVHVANGLNWRPTDELSLSDKWRSLHIDLPVCVSAALARGITDQDNADRHNLPKTNLESGFRLTGLGELADAMLNADKIIQL